MRAHTVTSHREAVCCSLCLHFCLFCCFSLCIFCGERSDSFTEEGLDLHYWKHCLMLTRCDHCRQVRRWAGSRRAVRERPNHKNTQVLDRSREKLWGKQWNAYHPVVFRGAFSFYQCITHMCKCIHAVSQLNESSRSRCPVSPPPKPGPLGFCPLCSPPQLPLPWFLTPQISAFSF